MAAAHLEAVDAEKRTERARDEMKQTLGIDYVSYIEDGPDVMYVSVKMLEGIDRIAPPAEIIQRITPIETQASTAGSASRK